MLQSGKADTCYAHLVPSIYPKAPEGLSPRARPGMPKHDSQQPKPG